MKLLVISGMPHYEDAGGNVHGWGPTVQELDHLAGCFSEVHHLALLHEGPPPPTAARYTAGNVTTTLVRARGGQRLAEKIALIAAVPGYVYTTAREIRTRKPDAVHVRCPANLSMIALPVVRLLHRGPCWVKYAGNWNPDREPLSYTLQRWWLRRRQSRCAVTVNGEWPGSPAHVVDFRNPSLTEADLQAAQAVTSSDKTVPPFRLLFVGRVEKAKGIDVVLGVAKLLSERGIDYRLEVVGDGREKPAFERLAAATGVADRVEFLGWMSKQSVNECYRRARVVLLPSASEGWPKVLSEAMAYGAVPVASAVSAIPRVLASTGAGYAVAGSDPRAYADVVEQLMEDPQEWRRASEAGQRAAPQFGYASYLSSVRNLFEAMWGVTLRCNE